MIEVRTRLEFLDIADAIDICKFREASVEFREACFTLKRKVNKVIRERMEDVFKVDKEKQLAFDKAKFEYCKKFAIRDDKKEIVYNNEEKTSYNFDFSRFNRKEVDDDIENWIQTSEWKDFINDSRRIEKEKQEWLNKKIKLDLKKLDSISKIPPIIGTYEQNRQHFVINENTTYDTLVDVLCTEKIQDSEEDGAEVEE